jgi:hypothetical protein
MRTKPSELVAKAIGRSKAKTWLERLPAKDRAYVSEIVKEIRKTPGVNIQAIVRLIVSELHLNVSLITVRQTISELINA